MDKERASSRFPGDPFGVGSAGRITRTEEFEGQDDGIRSIQRFDSYFATDEGRVHHLAQGAQERAGRLVLVTESPNRKHDRRVRGTKQFGQHQGAVGVAPLQVVDGQDQRTTVADPRQKLAQAGEGTTTDLVWVVGLDGRSRGRGDGRDSAQNREDPRQRMDVARQQSRHVTRRQMAEVATQRVDQAIQRLCTGPTPARSIAPREPPLRPSP